jgi:hypothetical protein
MKSTIFWDITPCSPLSVNRRFGGTYRLHLQGRSEQETSVKGVNQRQLTLNVLYGVISQKIILFSKILSGYPVFLAKFEPNLLNTSLENSMVLWVVTPCCSGKSRRCGVIYRLHPQGIKVSQVRSRRQVRYKLHGITTQKTALSIVTSVRTSDPKRLERYRCAKPHVWVSWKDI